MWTGNRRVQSNAAVMLTASKRKDLVGNTARVTFGSSHMNSAGSETGPPGDEEVSYCVGCGSARKGKELSAL